MGEDGRRLRVLCTSTGGAGHVNAVAPVALGLRAAGHDVRWAVAPDGEPRGAGGERSTTNQRMEITAVLEALRTLGGRDGTPRAVRVVSDSTYVINCFRDGWWKRWEANGWRNAKKQPVANADLWRPLIELVEANDVSFGWVKGHSGDRLNDLVDGLAVAAIPR